MRRHERASTHTQLRLILSLLLHRLISLLPTTTIPALHRSTAHTRRQHASQDTRESSSRSTPPHTSQISVLPARVPPPSWHRHNRSRAFRYRATNRVPAPPHRTSCMPSSFNSPFARGLSIGGTRNSSDSTRTWRRVPTLQLVMASRVERASRHLDLSHRRSVHASGKRRSPAFSRLLPVTRGVTMGTTRRCGLRRGCRRWRCISRQLSWTLMRGGERARRSRRSLSGR